MQPNEIENFVDLPEPAGGEKEETAGRLPAAFRERFLGGSCDRAFPERTEDQPGTCA